MDQSNRCVVCGDALPERSKMYCGKTCAMKAAAERRKAKIKNDPEYAARHYAMKRRASSGS